MKVRVYDSGKDFVDRYTLYFPYSKKLREHDGRTIMGCFLSFNFREGQLTFYAWDYDDRSLGYNIPRNEKKVKIETLPQFVQNYIVKMERIWNDALKYDDKKHWDAWIYA